MEKFKRKKKIINNFKMIKKEFKDKIYIRLTKTKNFQNRDLYTKNQI